MERSSVEKEKLVSMKITLIGIQVVPKLSPTK